jgi:hypothetical protein
LLDKSELHITTVSSLVKISSLLI